MSYILISIFKKIKFLLIVLALSTLNNHYSSVQARVSCGGNPLGIELLQPAYLFNAVRDISYKLLTDMDLLELDDVLYKSWLIESDYFIDSFLHLYSAVTAMTSAKNDLHLYLYEDTEFLIDIIHQVQQRYSSFLSKASYPAELNALFIFLGVLTHKIIGQALLLRRLNKEVLLEDYAKLVYWHRLKTPRAYKA